MKIHPLRTLTVLLVLALSLQIFSFATETASAAVAKTNLKVVELNKNWKAIGQYSEGLCPVQDKTSGMWGYVDKTGNFTIKPQYYDAMPFSEGLAAVKNSSGYYDFIDKLGKVIVKGNYTKVMPRFMGVNPGFSKGYAVVSTNPINKSGTYLLIDRSGKIEKELDYYISFDIERSRFENKGDIVTNRDKDNHVYDFKYTKVAEFGAGRGSSRILFNLSSKYIIVEEENGLVIGSSNGQKIFTQEQVEGMDKTSSYKMGVTNDYAVITRNINGITASAVYDFKGNIVIDYKYKEIMPLSKDMFLVKNNADTFGIVDLKGKELLPFSLELSVLSRAAQMDVIYRKAQQLGGIDFLLKDKQGNNKAKYFDLKTKKINDYFVMNLNGYSVNAYNFRHNTNAGIIHLYTSNYDVTIYNQSGEKIGSFICYYSPGNKLDLEASTKAFLSEGVIPVVRKDKTGYTFAIITKK